MVCTALAILLYLPLDGLSSETDSGLSRLAQAPQECHTLAEGGGFRPEVANCQVFLEIAPLVFDGQRALFERREVASYLEIYTPDAQVVAGRGPEPGPYDWSIGREALGATTTYLISESMFWRHAMDYTVTGFTLEENRAVLEVQATAQTGDIRNVMNEVYRLRFTDGGWRVDENRWWPVENHTDSVDADYYARVDALALAAAARGDLHAQVGPLLDGNRIPEAYAVARRIAELPAADAPDWVWRGLLALRIGDLADGQRSFERARAIDPQALVPFQHAVQAAERGGSRLAE